MKERRENPDKLYFVKDNLLNKRVKLIDNQNLLVMKLDSLNDELMQKETQTIDEWGDRIESDPALLTQLKKQINQLKKSIEHNQSLLKTINLSLEPDEESSDSLPEFSMSNRS